MRKLFEIWKKYVKKANSYGIPLPLVHDPKANMASVSLTLVFVSSLLVIIGIVGKWSQIAGAIDMSSAMEFFYASSALYFGRQWQMKDGTKIEGSTNSTSLPDSQSPP
jgi:hypothetical protein